MDIIIRHQIVVITKGESSSVSIIRWQKIKQWHITVID